MAASGNGAMQRSMMRMAEQDPQLAGRLFVAALPAAAASVSGKLRYRLELSDVGSYDVSVRDGDVQVMEIGGTAVKPPASSAAPASNGAPAAMATWPNSRPSSSRPSGSSSFRCRTARSTS